MKADRPDRVNRKVLSSYLGYHRKRAALEKIIKVIKELLHNYGYSFPMILKKDYTCWRDLSIEFVEINKKFEWMRQLRKNICIFRRKMIKFQKRNKI